MADEVSGLAYRDLVIETNLRPNYMKLKKGCGVMGYHKGSYSLFKQNVLFEKESNLFCH